MTVKRFAYQCAHSLPVGATYVDSHGPSPYETVYWKIRPDLWDDCIGEHGHQVSGRWVDSQLSRGRGEIAVMDLELKTETTAGWDVEHGDYVVLTLDFLGELHDPEIGEDRGAFFRPTSSQQLWRVAGWVHHGDDCSQIVLDAPREQMFMLTRLYRGHADGDQEETPLELSVFGDDTFQVVLPDQNHHTWDYEWEDGFFDFVDPRPL